MIGQKKGVEEKRREFQEEKGPRGEKRAQANHDCTESHAKWYGNALSNIHSFIRHFK